MSHALNFYANAVMRGESCWLSLLYSNHMRGGLTGVSTSFFVLPVLLGWSTAEFEFFAVFDAFATKVLLLNPLLYLSVALPLRRHAPPPAFKPASKCCF